MQKHVIANQVKIGHYLVLGHTPRKVKAIGKKDDGTLVFTYGDGNSLTCSPNIELTIALFN